MKRWTWSIPVLLAILVYIPSLSEELVWDDAIVMNQQILTFKNVGDVFSPPDHIPQWAKNYYRPVVVLTYLVDQFLYGSNAAVGSRLSNILFHGLVTFFVWIFALQCLRGLTCRHWSAVLAASVFAVHPIHTESVSWITGRSDTVAAMFMMPSIVVALYYRDRKTPWALVLAPALFLLAALAKEVALSTLLVLPVLFFVVPKKDRSLQTASKQSKQKGQKRTKNKKASAPSSKTSNGPATRESNMRSQIGLGALYLVALIIYLGLRQGAHIGYGSALGVVPSELFLRALRASAYYVLKTIVPTPQLHFVSLENLPNAAEAILILLVATATVAGILFWWRRGAPPILISLGWFVCTLSPSLVIAVAKISETPVAERYLYIPSVALSLGLAAAFCIAMGQKRLHIIAIGSAMVVMSFYSVGTLRRGMVWTDNVRLWTDATQKAPNHGLPWTELGMAYTVREKLDEALSCFHKATKAEYDREGRSIAYSNMAMIHAKRRELNRAEWFFQEAIRERETYPIPHYGLGLLHLEAMKQAKSVKEAMVGARKAEKRFQAAVRMNSNYVKALWGLTQSRMTMGDLATSSGDNKLALAYFHAALDTFQSLLQVDPHFMSAHPKKAEAVKRLQSRLGDLEGAS